MMDCNIAKRGMSVLFCENLFLIAILKLRMVIVFDGCAPFEEGEVNILRFKRSSKFT